MWKPVGRARWAIIAYLALLLASHAARRLAPAPPPPELDSITVRTVTGERTAPRRVPLYYREWRPAGSSPASTLLLLHGSPGDGSDFESLGPVLGRSYRVLAPDLPGFGVSHARVPDYSTRAQAGYALQMLDALEVASAHVVGASTGGAAAVRLADRAPERVRSLTLIAAGGVEELELLGYRPLNRAVYWLQLATVWALREGLPHFGLLDGSSLSVSYARSYYESDPRPLRAALHRLQAPTLILHGRDDVVVPPAAALEHHRLVPHSELALLDGGHRLLARNGQRLAMRVLDFVDRVQSGQATARDGALPERVRRAGAPFDPATVPPARGKALLVIVALLIVATLISEDLTCIAAGLLAASGRVDFLPAAGACFAGILLGDLGLFWAGRLGRSWLHRRPLSWIVKPETVRRSANWFARRGPMVIVLSRFLPGTRVATYFAAGVLRMSFRRFFLYFVLAVAVWAPALIYLAMLLGAPAMQLLQRYRAWALPAFVAVALLLWGALSLGERLATARGRRLLAGWWHRTTRWEFWPAWLLYLPLGPWLAWLSLRHRSVTLFTAANPAIPAGGLVGESKSEILSGLPPGAIARFRRIGPELSTAEKVGELERFLAQSGLDLPVVLKPDVGERGRDVKIARTAEQAASYLAEAGGTVLAQEYVRGREYGVFYYRRPDAERGTIFSITEKRLPRVTGDGHSSVEKLILADPRAVALARVYIVQLGERAEYVPEVGETVRLTDLGTHCRGAVFLDGAHLGTPDLERRIDELSRSFRGFYFGRYDVRTPSEAAFREGRELTVLELNGVTSEATHIYDPVHSLGYAYRTLFRQWSLAYEIGRLNRDAGIAPAGVGEILRRIWKALFG